MSESTPFEYVGEYLEHRVQWNERNKKNSIRVKVEGRGPDRDGPTKTRTISLWQTDKDGNQAEWVAGLLEASLLPEGDPRKVFVFKGFSTSGPAPDGGVNTYWNGTKVERYDPETYQPGSARQAVGSPETGGGGAGVSRPEPPPSGSPAPSYMALTPRDEARWAVEVVAKLHGSVPGSPEQLKVAANQALTLILLVDETAKRRRDAEA